MCPERSDIYGLTIKQKKFADEYIISGNATEAYKKAYTNIKKDETARANASRMLTNANVKNYIDERMKEIDKSKIADQQEVMEFLTTTMRDDENATKDRLKAAELIGKRHMMWSERIEANVNSNNTNPLQGFTTEELKEILRNIKKY